MQQTFVYILASTSRVLYVGVTTSLERRVQQHRIAKRGFTARYRVRRLVYVEATESRIAGIRREKQIKAWRRSKKVALIEAANPGWADLAWGWGGTGARGQ